MSDLSCCFAVELFVFVRLFYRDRIVKFLCRGQNIEIN